MTTVINDVPCLLALGIIRNWLSGSRHGNTHSELCTALRENLGITLSNQDIDVIFHRAADLDCSPGEILARLLENDSDQSRPVKPR